MAETENQRFLDSIAEKRPNTIKSYKTQYNKLRKGLNADINTATVKDIIKVADEQNTANSTQAIINIGILIKRLYENNEDADELIKIRDGNKDKIVEQIKEKNTDMDLPSYEDINDYMDFLYTTGKYREYLINYLLINYQVRNQDLVTEIVKRKKDVTDDTKNYIWINNKGDVVYYRNDYKTAQTYGSKQHQIKDPKFSDALRKMLLKNQVLVPNPDTVDYYVSKATLDRLGEGKYFKIIVNHFRDNLNKLKEISENRGTNIETILSHYDIENK